MGNRGPAAPPVDADKTEQQENTPSTKEEQPVRNAFLDPSSTVMNLFGGRARAMLEQNKKPKVWTEEQRNAYAAELNIKVAELNGRLQQQSTKKRAILRQGAQAVKDKSWGVASNLQKMAETTDQHMTRLSQAMLQVNGLIDLIEQGHLTAITVKVMGTVLKAQRDLMIEVGDEEKLKQMGEDIEQLMDEMNEQSEFLQEIMESGPNAPLPLSEVALEGYFKQEEEEEEAEKKEEKEDVMEVIPLNHPPPVQIHNPRPVRAAPTAAAMLLQ